MSSTEALEELIRQRDETITDLQRIIVEKEDRIHELLSQLDKYRSVLQLAGPVGGVAAGLLLTQPVQDGSGGRSTVASTAAGRKLQRAWGISAEPQSSLSGGRSDNASLTLPSQKFFKDQR